MTSPRFCRFVVLAGIAAAAAALCPATAAAQTYSNTSPITIPSFGSASPYPSTISVSGVNPLADRITVTVSGLYHTFPDDLDMLLVGPQGQTVLLLSDAGGSCAVENLSITFADGAPAAPNGCTLSSTTYAPTDYEFGEVLPGPAPFGPYGTTLASALRPNLNGIWRLYVYDDAANDSGLITGGWSITFSVTPAPFTYQGVLRSGNAAVNGPTDLEFSLWTQPDGGAQLGATASRPATPVQAGVFTTELDFGLAFDGSDRWLQVVVNGTPLSPRQRIAATPQATRALAANVAHSVSWNDIQDMPEGFADGIDDNPWQNFGGDLFYGGNVGVGTLPGTNRLGVLGNARISGFLGIGANSPTAPLSFTTTTLGDNIIFAGAAGAGNYGIGLQVAQLQIHTAGSAQDIVFGWGHSAAMNETVRFKGNGEVNIGNIINPTASVLLRVGGNAAKPGGGSWALLSDERAKRDIHPLTGALARLLQLRGVTYQYTDPPAQGQLPGTQIGVVAQDVQQVFPDWVDTREDGLKIVTFRGFEALTIEAFRELQAENAHLRARLERLEALLSEQRHHDRPLN